MGELARLPKRPTEDLFRVDDGSYSPDNYYTSATDGRGNTASLRVSIPPAVASEIEQIIQQRLIPAYRHHNHLIRDAVIHRLWYLKQQERLGRLGKTLDLYMRLADQERRMEEGELYNTYIRTVRDGLEQAEGEGNEGLVTEMVLALWVASKEFREPYRGRAERLAKGYAEEVELGGVLDQPWAWPDGMKEDLMAESVAGKDWIEEKMKGEIMEGAEEMKRWED